MSNLEEHAKRELLALGYDPNEKQDDPNKWIQDNILELIRVFAKQDHSGSSAPYCVNLFSKLAMFEPACPLTGEDSEWNEVGADGENGVLYQNNRCSHVFKNDKGAYDTDGKIFREPNGCCYTSFASHVPVTFPYTPKREYVDVEVTP